MQKKNYKGRCEKRQCDKANGIVKLYSSLQMAYLKKLEENDSITSVTVNAAIEDNSIGDFTSDFFCQKSSGEYMVRECVREKYLGKPKTIKELDFSREYWLKHGVNDWGLVLEEHTI